jgi:excisionase family DNA binding protein
MTVKEVTAFLGCHRITILRLIRRKELHPLMVGKTIRFERAEVARLNNRKIAVYPHLTIVRGSNSSRHVSPPVILS